MHRKTDSNNPADWLFFAQEDLAAVSLLAEREICYHVCQSKLAEALEKVLKGELIYRGWFLDKVHDLQKLADELTDRNSDLADAARPIAEALADSYFSERYPGFDLEEPDWDDLRFWLEEVQQLSRRLESRIEKYPRG